MTEYHFLDRERERRRLEAKIRGPCRARVSCFRMDVSLQMPGVLCPSCEKLAARVIREEDALKCRAQNS